MSIPTRTLTVRAFDHTGAALAGAVVTALLSDYDVYQNQYVYPVEKTATADGSGVATLALFPNALGQRNTTYQVKVKSADGVRTYLSTVINMPNADKSLDELELTSSATPENTGIDNVINLPFLSQDSRFLSFLKNWNTASRTYTFPDASGTVMLHDGSIVPGQTVGILTLLDTGLVTARAIAGTTNQVTVTNGNGVAGNPTISLPQDIATGSSPTFANLTLSGGLTVTGNVSGGNLSTAGNLTVTGTGNLGALGVTGNASAGNLTVSGTATAATGNFTSVNVTGNASVGNLTVTGTITGLDPDLTAIAALAGTGFAVRSAANTWVQRDVTAGNGITIGNGNGVAGNVTVTLTGAPTAAGQILSHNGSAQSSVVAPAANGKVLTSNLAVAHLMEWGDPVVGEIEVLEITGILTPAQITASQNDYAPSGITGNSVVRHSSNQPVNITGFNITANGRTLIHENVGNQPITLAVENSGSSAENRITASANVVLDENDVTITAYDPTTQRHRVLAQPPNGAYRSVQVITANGSYNKPVGLRRAEVIVIGGGGPGGGAQGTGGGQYSCGGGGGGGGGAIKVIPAANLSASETVTIGTGGAGVSGGAGSAGGTTSFGSHLSATGGGAGSTGAAGGSVNADGADGGTGSGGDVNFKGGGGGPGNGYAGGSILFAGAGGSSILGGGGRSPVNGTHGVSGGAYGGGGSGCCQIASGGALTGGSGSSGVVIVKEFF